MSKPFPSLTTLAPDATQIDHAFDGVRIHAATWGEQSDRPTLVLHHHYYGNSMVWRKVAPLLATDRLVIAIDRPGFGLTERPDRDAASGRNAYTRAFTIDATADLLRTHDITSTVVIGSSMGGTTTLETAVRNDWWPDVLRGIVAMSPAITGDVGAPVALRPFLRSRPWHVPGGKLVSRFAGEISAPRVANAWRDPSRATEEDAAVYRLGMNNANWPTGMWHKLTAEAPPSIKRKLDGITVPTLVISGDSDPTIKPRLTQRTASWIPGAEFVMIPDAGHTPHEEQPAALAAAINAFLAEI